MLWTHVGESLTGRFRYKYLNCYLIKLSFYSDKLFSLLGFSSIPGQGRWELLTFHCPRLLSLIPFIVGSEARGNSVTLCAAYRCCAREMLVIPQNTQRSRYDTIHSRIFILFKLARALPTYLHHTGWFWWREEPRMSIGFIVISKQGICMCASI